jgi:hypothetical protein
MKLAVKERPVPQHTFPITYLCFIAKKVKQINLKTKEINWLIGKKNPIYLQKTNRSSTKR